MAGFTACTTGFCETLTLPLTIFMKRHRFRKWPFLPSILTPHEVHLQGFKRDWTRRLVYGLHFQILISHRAK
jgi:hypothetical protein